MRNYRNRSRWLLLLLLALAWADAEATKATFPRHVVVDTTAVDWTTGEAKIRVILTPLPKSQKATLRIVPNGKIVIHHSLESAVDFTAREADTLSFTVNFPPRDTVGLRVFIERDNHSVFDDLYFVTTDSQPKLFLHCDPRHLSPQPPIESFWQLDIDPGKKLPQELPGYARPPQDSVARIAPADPDSMSPGAARTTKSRTEQEIQRELEQTQLTGKLFEFIRVDSQLLVRETGEYKFRSVDPNMDTEAWAKRRYDSVVHANRLVTYDMWLDLRDPENLAFARSVIDSLTVTDTVGIYRAQITRAILGKLQEEGIPSRLWGTPSSVED